MAEPQRRTDLFLAPLAQIPWVLFLVVSAIALCLMPFDIGAVEAEGWFATPALREAATGLLQAIDALWITLAAIVVYIESASVRGMSATRRWAATLIAAAVLLEWIAAATGSLFGPRTFTDRLGYRLGNVVPFAMPLLWLVVVLAGRGAVDWIAPRAGRIATALGVGTVGLLTALNAEYVAAKVRLYWIWNLGAPTSPNQPPLIYYASWFVASALLAFSLGGDPIIPPRTARKSAATLLILNALFSAVHLIHALKI
jgi:uncharacterized membrane protein